MAQRKVTLYLHMSLDNVVSDPERWMIMNDGLLQESMNYYQTIDTVLFGSKTYPSLADYWQEAEKTSTSPTEKKFAKQFYDIQKFVLSRSDVDLVWRSSQLLQFKDVASLSQSLENLKSQPGKDISVESGIGLWKLFLEHGLFDELLLYIQPVVAGIGEKLFTDTVPTTRLKLTSTKAFESGVIEVRYERVK